MHSKRLFVLLHQALNHNQKLQLMDMLLIELVLDVDLLTKTHDSKKSPKAQD